VSLSRNKTSWFSFSLSKLLIVVSTLNYLYEGSMHISYLPGIMYIQQTIDVFVCTELTLPKMAVKFCKQINAEGKQLELSKLHGIRAK